MALEPLTDEEQKVLDFEEEMRIAALNQPRRRFSHQVSNRSKIIAAGWGINAYYLILTRAMRKPIVALEWPELYRTYQERMDERASERYGRRRKAS